MPDRQPSTWRAVRLLMLTLIAPGTAQVIAGSMFVGVVALVLYAVVLGVTVGAGLCIALGVSSETSVLAGLLDPDTLGNMRIAILVLAAGWLGLFVDAWRLGRPMSTGAIRRLAIVFMAIGLICGIAGLALAGAGSIEAARVVIRSIFTSKKVSDPEQGRYNVLLLGGDAGVDRIGLRPDSINLVSIDEATGRAAIFGFPRNLQRVRFPEGTEMKRAWPWGFDCEPDCMLNAVYTWANQHRSLFPRDVLDPGMYATRQAVEELSGLSINYHVMVDMAGFRDLIDAVRGITLDVRRGIPIAGLASPRGTGHHDGPRWIPPGRQHLDGTLALAYARSRTGASDYQRMARQRCVMTAMLRQLSPSTVLARFQEVARASGNLVRTDIPVTRLLQFVRLADRARSQPIDAVQFVPPLIRPAHPDFWRIRHIVRETLESRTPASATSAASDLPTC